VRAGPELITAVVAVTTRASLQTRVGIGRGVVGRSRDLPRRDFGAPKYRASGAAPAPSGVAKSTPHRRAVVIYPGEILAFQKRRAPGACSPRQGSGECDTPISVRMISRPLPAVPPISVRMISRPLPAAPPISVRMISRPVPAAPPISCG
jgi:hypothetical protein